MKNTTTKVRKEAKIRKRYNQVHHWTQDTTWESNKNTINITNKIQEASPFSAGDHKVEMNRRERMRNTRHKKYKINDQQNKYRLKPLSHQGGVLTVIPRCTKIADRRGVRSTNASITAATQWHRHWTRWGRIERRATVRTLSILKTNTVTWRSLGA